MWCLQSGGSKSTRQASAYPKLYKSQFSSNQLWTRGIQWTQASAQIAPLALSNIIARLKISTRSWKPVRKKTLNQHEFFISRATFFSKFTVKLSNEAVWIRLPVQTRNLTRVGITNQWNVMETSNMKPLIFSTHSFKDCCLLLLSSLWYRLLRRQSLTVFRFLSEDFV